MEEKRRGLPSREKEIPLLPPTERERIEFSFDRQRRLRRAYRVYMASAATVLILALVVLLIGFDGNRFRGVLGSLGGGGASVGTQSDTHGGTESEDGKDESSDVLEKPDDTRPSEESKPTEDEKKDLYFFDYSAVPQGEIPILPMDLSLVEYGAGYVQNQTDLKPDPEALLRRPLWPKEALPEPLSQRTAEGPKVLIVHTHATEAYSEDGAVSCTEEESAARSSESGESVIGVGRVLADSLNRLGISTVHCQVQHDAQQYKGAYERAKETVERYLEQYPSICLVIDLHRDAIVNSSGEMIRPVTLVDGEATAQVMCVVGSDFGGEANPNWEGNLALALQLRERLNAEYGNLCRPPYLKAATYNQELAPYSLLLEIGASGNSLAEAKRAAQAVAGALFDLLGEGLKN